MAHVRRCEDARTTRAGSHAQQLFLSTYHAGAQRMRDFGPTTLTRTCPRLPARAPSAHGHAWRSVRPAPARLVGPQAPRSAP
eukprot:1668068-Prymnesium_polylepis.2